MTPLVLLTAAALLSVVLLWLGYRLGSSQGPKQRNREAVVPAAPFNHAIAQLNDKLPELPTERFIEHLPVSTETLDVHLAVGSLARERGEVDKAIRVHQNLLESELDRASLPTVRFELARDYLSAGLLDRAETLFSDLTEDRSPVAEQAREYLLEIYQREHDWQDAEQLAAQIIASGNADVSVYRAQYLCELGDDAAQSEHASNVSDRSEESSLRVSEAAPEADAAGGSDFGSAGASETHGDIDQYYKLALQVDPGCVRATLALGGRYIQAAEQYAGATEQGMEHWRQALESYERIVTQDVRFLREALPHMWRCHQALGSTAAFRSWLESHQDQVQSVSLLVMLAEVYRVQEDIEAARALLRNSLDQRPTLRNLLALIQLELERVASPLREDLEIIGSFTSAVVAVKPIYRCDGCGFAGRILNWQCPSCKRWGSVAPISGLEGE